MKRPKRLSMGCYVVDAAGKKIVLQRVGRSGFKIVTRPGAISPMVKRLRDAVALAIASADPWPFDVPKQFDGALDIPPFLRRTA